MIGRGRSADVRLSLYDAQGRRVVARASEGFEAGASVVSWGLPRVVSGVYFLKLAVVGQLSVSSRLLILD